MIVRRSGFVCLAVLAWLALAPAVSAQNSKGWEKRLEQFLKALGFAPSDMRKAGRVRSSGTERPKGGEVVQWNADTRTEKVVADCAGCYSLVRWSDQTALAIRDGELIEVDLIKGIRAMGKLPGGTRELLMAKAGEAVWIVKRDTSTQGCAYAIWKWDVATQQAAADETAPCLPATELAELPKPGVAPIQSADASREQFDSIWLNERSSLFLRR